MYHLYHEYQNVMAARPFKSLNRACRAADKERGIAYVKDFNSKKVVYVPPQAIQRVLRMQS